MGQRLNIQFADNGLAIVPGRRRGRASLRHVELNIPGKAAATRRLCPFSLRRGIRPVALKILKQFIQLKRVADGVHDSVLQH